MLTVRAAVSPVASQQQLGSPRRGRPQKAVGRPVATVAPLGGSGADLGQWAALVLYGSRAATQDGPERPPHLLHTQPSGGRHARKTPHSTLRPQQTAKNRPGDRPGSRSGPGDTWTRGSLERMFVAPLETG